VESPRTGHGQHQAGSITVVDLIRRNNTGPIRIPSADERITEDFVEDLLGPADEDDRGRGRMARAAKFVGLAVGSVVLCGSIVAASTLAHQRKPAPTLGVSASTAPITGVGVLRPDTLRAQLGTARTTTPAATGATRSPRASTTAAGSAVGVAGITTRAPVVVVTTTVLAPPVAAGADPVTVVRDFYQLAVNSPASALSLLAPSLLSSDGSGFVDSWTSTRAVHVESVKAVQGSGASGMVQAVVRLLQPDGSWLRVVELLHVRPGAQPVIDQAELLSAQHG
jgi:hypothetical protein